MTDAEGPNQRLAAVVRHYIEHYDGSLQQLAERLREAGHRASSTSLSAWQSGRRRPADRATIRALRRVVGCRCLSYPEQVIEALMPALPATGDDGVGRPVKAVGGSSGRGGSGSTVISLWERLPGLPEGFVPRAAEGQALMESLVSSNAGSVALASTAVRGTGGFGKTTLAVWVCGRAEVRVAYPDGVLWIAVGQDPSEAKLIGLIRDAVSAITGEVLIDASLASAADRLSSALADRRMLMVIDDVWRRRDLEPFWRGGPHCVRLITTRQRDVAVPATPTRATMRVIRLDRMAAPEAMALLRRGLPGVSNAELLPLHDRCGRWPLVIALLNGVLRSLVSDHGLGVSDAITHVVAELEQRGGLSQLTGVAGDREHDAAASIGLSLAQLGRSSSRGGEAVRRFLMLAAFPPDTRIDYRQLGRLWDCSELLARQQCSRYADHSLLGSLTPDGVTLHDVIHGFLAHEYAVALREAHRRLVEAYRALCGPDGWHTIAGGEAGFLDDLSYHLSGAGLFDELLSITTDLRFLAERVRRSGPSALVVDAGNRGPSDDYSRGLSELVRNEAHLLVGHARLGDLAATLYSQTLGRPSVAGRLRYVDTMLAGLLAAAMPFPDLPDPRMRRVLTGHTGDVTALAWRADGDRLASGGLDAQILVHRPDSDDPSRDVRLLGEAVRSLAWSPDLLALAVATSDGKVTVVDPQDGSVLAERTGSGAGARLVWSPDSAQLAIGTEHGVELWNLADDTVRIVVTGSCRALDWSAYGLVAGQPGGALMLWDPALEHAETIDTDLQFIDSVSWHPHRRVVAAAGAGVVVATGTGQLQSFAEASSVHDVAWTDDGALLAGATMGEVLIWRAQAESPEHLAGLHDRIRSNDLQVGPIAAQPGRPVIAAGSRAAIRLWDPSLRPAQPSQAQVNVISWSPVGDVLAVGTAEREVLFVDPVGNIAVPVSSGQNTHTDELCALAWSPDGQRLLSIDYDARLVVWDVTNRSPVRVLASESQTTRTAVWHPGGKLVAVGGATVTFCEPSSWQVAAEHDFGGAVTSLAFDPAGRRLAIVTDEATLVVTDIGDLRRTARWAAHRGNGTSFSSSINSVAWSPDGQRLVTAGKDGTVACWDADGGSLFTRTGDGSPFRQAVFSPDGRRIVGVTADGSALLWDARRGSRLCRLAVDGALTSCGFAPAGDQLSLGGANGWYLCRVVPGAAPTDP
jgi:WD40 repeat protein